ncbi:hypothetical protein TrRE_jg11935 [Triparma retinervis]|uniref:WW domain-containing protein n=1 Tax=Triparma retinervis TaxID=2557542 RepID=A0A9W7G8Q5_9STRA|nr:hypothetical protein TrRE_jg11935 [Triparma retinervis]
MRIYAGCKPFVDENIDRFSEVAQWQLFFTLFAALAMKVNMDDENLQNRGYFDMILTCIQFVPVLIVTGTNMVKAKNATKAAKGLLGSTVRSGRSGSDKGGAGALEMGEISVTVNPLPESQKNKKNLAPHLARVQTFKSESKAALSKPFARSPSKEQTSLGGEVVSKHKKIEKRATQTLAQVKEEGNKAETTKVTWEKHHDATSGHDFYENTVTGETQWTNPAGEKEK